MSIVVACPGCPTKLSAPESAAGKQIRCPKCGAIALVPAFVAAEEVPVVDAAVVRLKPAPKPARVDEDEEDEKPRKKRRDEEEEERPRKKKRRGYADDDDDYDHDHPRRKRQKAGGGSGGMIAIFVVGGVLLLLGIGIAVYLFSGKGSPFARKTPVPDGWEQHSYPSDGFKAYFPKTPTVMTVPVNGFVGGGMPGRGAPRLGGRGAWGGAGPWGGAGVGDPNEEIREAESVSFYSSGDHRDSVHIELVVVRYKSEVPASARQRIRDLRTGKADGIESRSIKWLGYDAVELVMPNAVMRGVYTDRTMIMATITGPNGSRAKPEEEAGFFENFELTK